MLLQRPCSIHDTDMLKSVTEYMTAADTLAEAYKILQKRQSSKPAQERGPCFKPALVLQHKAQQPCGEFPGTVCQPSTLSQKRKRSLSVKILKFVQLAES